MTSLNSTSRRAGDPVWSPDGSHLAFILRQPERNDVLATSAADGTDLKTVMTSDGAYPFFRNPAWATDGSSLVVVRSSGGVYGELWLVPLAGGQPRRLTNDPPGVFCNEPTFDARRGGILHQSNRAGAVNLWIQPLDGRPPHRLTTGPGPDESPSVSKDGSIAFVNSRSRSALIVFHLKTGNTSELLTHAPFLWAPVLSPDGREIAYSQGETDGSWHIWILPTEGGTPRRLTSGPLPAIYPRFTPDGTSVIYHTWSSGPDRVWRVPRAGGPATPLTPVREEDDQFADISPDGRYLAFARTEKETTRICVAPLQGGEARYFTTSPSTLPRWSPDGRWIAFSPSRGYDMGIFVIAADGTALRRLTSFGGWPVWWPKEERVAFIALPADGTQQILSIPFTGGPTETVRSPRFVGWNYPFDISADKTLLVTSNSISISGEIWLLEPR